MEEEEDERRVEGHHSRQWRQQQQRLVIDIRVLALPPDPASQPASSKTELTEPRWMPLTAPNEPHRRQDYAV